MSGPLCNAHSFLICGFFFSIGDVGVSVGVGACVFFPTPIQSWMTRCEPMRNDFFCHESTISCYVKLRLRLSLIAVLFTFFFFVS